MSRRIAPHLTKSTKARDTIDTDDARLQQDMNYRTAGGDAFARARQDSQASEDFLPISSELTTLQGTNKFQRQKSRQKVTVGKVAPPPETEKQSLTFEDILVNGKDVFRPEEKSTEDFKSNEFAYIIKKNFRQPLEKIVLRNVKCSDFVFQEVCNILSSRIFVGFHLTSLALENPPSVYLGNLANKFHLFEDLLMKFDESFD